jgi:hypothetical protein
VASLVLKLVNGIYLLRLLSLLAMLSMPLQPELKEKARQQVSSMYLNLKKLQRKPDPTGKLHEY